ncbi:hypothetical protein [Sulfobacillus harzensis]|uniref:Uncharacterized protein n=1 Tax=Sulfobacillus harzensis TaxID=2729629 RepID=A0A7Y0L8E5_9FIRM|nr:hypothetical protein [Sulfobacillus harzensis]NMP24913.1 hypothetical protein [Sulfobacillus harzensis]
MDRSDCVLLPEFAHRDVLDSPLTPDELRASVDRYKRLDVVLAVSLHDVYEMVRRRGVDGFLDWLSVQATGEATLLGIRFDPVGVTTDKRLLLHLRGNAGLILDNKGGSTWS